ncbi:MAG: hypothetical protein K2M16_06900, partial [Muribaculaceae bacterium]|nr:hypothetical protein [Muribaculaceae bacterium]
SKGYLAEHPDVAHFIYGHLHILKQLNLSPSCDITILGEWIKTFSYATLDESGELSLHAYQTTVLTPSTA